MKAVDDYLDRLAEGLDFLDPETAKDLVDEMRSHILDMAEAAGKDPDEIAAGLGSPEEIAASYREEFGRGSSKADEEKADGDRNSGPSHGKGFCGWDGPWSGDGPWNWWRGKSQRHPGREERHHRHEGGEGFGRPFPPMPPFQPFESFFQDRMRRAFEDIFTGSGGKRESKTVERSFAAPEDFRIDLRAADLVLAPAVEGTELKISFEIEGPAEAVAAWEPRLESEGKRLALSSDERPFRIRVLSARVLVPAGLRSIEAKTLSGDIEADSMPCASSLSTLSGDIETRAQGGPLKARSMSGSIEIRGARDLEISSASGSVEIREADGGIAVSTASGRIELKDCSGATELRSASGRMEASAHKGGIVARTSSGDMEIEALESEGAIDVKTVSGNIELKVNGRDAKVELSSASGELSVNGEKGRGGLSRSYGKATRLIGARSVSGNIEVETKD